VKTSIIGLVALGALSLGLAACGNNNNTSLPVLGPGNGLATPLPTNPPTSTASYAQIELLSRPAVKEALESFNNHKVTNTVEPYVGSPADPLQNEIMATEDLVRPPNSAVGSDYGKVLQKILYPNEIAVDLSNTTDKASYLGVETGGATGGKFGGRDIADDNEENNCISQQSPDVKTLQRPTQANIGTFPYLSPPH